MNRKGHSPVKKVSDNIPPNDPAIKKPFNRANVSIEVKRYVHKILRDAKEYDLWYDGLSRNAQREEHEHFMLDCNGKQIESFTTGIEFNNVRFMYDEAKILKNINLKVPKGKTIALVGSSGAGKSTLADLVPRFQIRHKSFLESQSLLPCEHTF